MRPLSRKEDVTAYTLIGIHNTDRYTSVAIESYPNTAQISKAIVGRNEEDQYGICLEEILCIRKQLHQQWTRGLLTQYN